MTEAMIFTEQWSMTEQLILVVGGLFHRQVIRGISVVLKSSDRLPSYWDVSKEKYMVS